jgi:sugar/nucleoside kinase (ribokinase family)
LGGLAGLVVAALASKSKDDSVLTGAGVGALGGLALGALAPMPLTEALDKAASSLGLTLVSLSRTGAYAATALVETRDGYHTVQCNAPQLPSREAIDDELYSGLVERMKSLACPT